MENTFNLRPIARTSSNALICPGCGEANLHLDSTEIFMREEDASEGLHVSVSCAGSSTDMEMKDNPSPRRDGTKIHFYCEHCSGEDYSKLHTMVILQHKGNTYMGWQREE